MYTLLNRKWSLTEIHIKQFFRGTFKSGISLHFLSLLPFLTPFTIPFSFFFFPASSPHFPFPPLLSPSFPLSPSNLSPPPLSVFLPFSQVPLSLFHSSSLLLHLFLFFFFLVVACVSFSASNISFPLQIIQTLQPMLGCHKH